MYTPKRLPHHESLRGQIGTSLSTGPRSRAAETHEGALPHVWRMCPRRPCSCAPARLVPPQVSLPLKLPTRNRAAPLADNTAKNAPRIALPDKCPPHKSLDAGCETA